MTIRLISTLLGLAFVTTLYAFPCTFTLVKDSCWKDYQVNILVYDVMDPKPMLSVTLPKGTPWVREKTECKAGQNINYSATFSPAIWKDKGKEVFFVKRVWTLPKKIKPGDSSWEVRLCFPLDFAKVPIPPTADANCVCDYKSVPIIPPAKLP